MWEKGCYNKNRIQCKSSRFAYFLRRNCVNSFQELVQSIDWGSLTDALLRVLGVFLCLPVSNLLLAMLLLLGARITIAHYVDTAFCSGLLNFLAMTAYMSVGLGLFNLIPISPLDGSKVLFAFLPDRAYMTLMRYEKYGMLVLFVLVWLGVGDNILSEGIYRVYELLVNWIVY